MSNERDTKRSATTMFARKRRNVVLEHHAQQEMAAGFLNYSAVTLGVRYLTPCRYSIE
jgi:hypothetical protein